MSFAGKKVLVIRPKALPQLGSDEFIEQLAATGANPLHLPVMRIDPFVVPLTAESASEPVEQIKTTVMALANYQVVIFFSRPAALLGADWIDHYWPQLPVGLQFFAVGDSTRQVLAEQGVDAQVPSHTQTSEGLLALPELQHLQDTKILICKGERGREFLADQLQQRGAQVDELNLYRRSPTNKHQEDIVRALQNGLNAVVAHSAELLESLLSQVPTVLHGDLFALPLVVPSERIADIATGKGFVNLQVANSAVPGDMVSALSRCYISD
ncbi:uroporphyrinogen-III synthase [Porticoccus sp. W117]|uniref:uroporphyrinogen-III synthase n=1 Tax=Porticoccus sp. W117 TaxID=3054777 RepID=UPI002593E70E|nr:uroporphyrinogen-III synthase [Porticoccus sp. W117]MDM3871737.1 uroporphyrinogen-III synthase [Porticoccus sp. W117]